MPAMETAPDAPTAAIRRFNRFYTGGSACSTRSSPRRRFSLTESRLLWELAQRGRATAAELARDLDLDPGYLSRLLRALKERALIRSARSPSDARHLHLSLTAAGRRAFAPLDARARPTSPPYSSRSPSRAARLVRAMAEIEAILGESRDGAGVPWQLRPPQPGDIGWAVDRHGRLYAAEYGWDVRFESLVARIAADFVDRFDAGREACWIAERDGANVGCVFLVQARDDSDGTTVAGTAQLRLLLVEPSARGLGIGARLVDECERFARAGGYRRIVCGPTACCWRRAASTRRRAIASSRASRTQLRPLPGRRNLAARARLNTGNRQARRPAACHHCRSPPGETRIRMHGLMQDVPLLISSLIEHADRHHGEVELVSRRVEGDLHRTTYRELHARAAPLANALDGVGVEWRPRRDAGVEQPSAHGALLRRRR